MTNLLSPRRILAAAPLWVLAGILLSAACSRADEPTEKHRRMENRFLFVVDASSAMKARAVGVEEAVNGLLESNMKGELRKGDTIGLWTYNDHLDTDFPMEVWSEKKRDGILTEVREHLLRLRYEKRAHLDKALPAITKVVESSERLTVILIFDGSDSIKGTPFDKDINGLHKRYAAEFRAAHAPFVTILAARQGAVFDYTLNYPGTVMVPHTADPLPPPETNAPPPLVASAPPPPVEPAPQPPPANVQIVLTGSNFAHNASAQPPAAGNVEAVVVPAPAPAVATNVTPPAEPAPVAVEAAPTNVAPLEPQRASPLAPSTPPPASVVTTPVKPAPVAPGPLPIPAAAAPVTSAQSTPVAPAVVAATSGQLAAMFIMAFSLLTIAVVLVLFLVRRWRGGPQPSLISQSIDRSH
jgi:hypothetical protein